MKYEAGTVLMVETLQRGCPVVRPAIVIDENDYGDIRVMFGATQYRNLTADLNWNLKKAPEAGDFVVARPRELEAMGLPQATRFSWKTRTWTQASKIKGVLGKMAKSVSDKAILSGMAWNV